LFQRGHIPVGPSAVVSDSLIDFIMMMTCGFNTAGCFMRPFSLIEISIASNILTFNIRIFANEMIDDCLAKTIATFGIL
jgi:hypothetical protein